MRIETMIASHSSQSEGRSSRLSTHLGKSTSAPSVAKARMCLDKLSIHHR